MKQPTRKEITHKICKVLDGDMTRESICRWAVDYIRNDEQVCVEDLGAWHYLTEISNIDELIAPNNYLFHEDDIRAIMEKYI